MQQQLYSRHHSPHSPLPPPPHPLRPRNEGSPSQWKAQQKILWAGVFAGYRKEGDLLADERCSQAILDFLPIYHGCGTGRSGEGRGRGAE